MIQPSSLVMQLFERMLRCDRVYEKNKQRLRLREAGYSGLSLLFSELHITPSLIRCLLNQVLHTGQCLTGFFSAASVFFGCQIYSALGKRQWSNGQRAGVHSVTAFTIT